MYNAYFLLPLSSAPSATSKTLKYEEIVDRHSPITQRGHYNSKPHEHQQHTQSAVLYTTCSFLQAPPCLLKILATELVSAIAIAGYGVARLVTQFGLSSRRIDNNGLEHLTTPSSS